jgi:hypothetical protein
MDGVNIVFALENEFDINVPDEEVKNIHSVRDMVDGVIRLVELGKYMSKADDGAPGESAPAAS